MKDKEIKVAGYIRVSTEGQAGDEKVSLQAQRKAIAQCAKTHGWTVHAIYEDHESGTKEARTNYKKMKGDGKEGHFQKVVFLAWDRFGRNARETLNAHKELEDLGITLYCVQAGIDTGTPEGKLFMTQMAGFAEYDRTNITRRMLQGRYHAAKAGKALAGRLPYGYAWEDSKGIVLVEQEAEMLKRMFHLYLVSRLSIREVVERLNKEGYRTRHGKVWQHSSLTRILKNPHYCGEMVMFGNYPEPVHLPCPKIITEAQHKKVLGQMAENNTRDLHPPHVRADDPYILRGLLKCSLCGSKLQTGRDGGNGPRAYMCLWSKHKHLLKEMAYQHKKPCSLPVMKAGELEDTVINRIEFLMVNPSKILALLQKEHADTGKMEKELAALHVRFTKAQAAYDRLFDLYGEGTINKADLTKKLGQQKVIISELEALRADLEARLELAKGKAKEAMRMKEDVESMTLHGGGRVHRAIKALDNAGRKGFLRTVIVNRLTVTPDGDAHGEYNFAAGYEWLGLFKTTMAFDSGLKAEDEKDSKSTAKIKTTLSKEYG